MTLLSKIQRGKQPLPPRLILYGTEGIGKSTFGSECPTTPLERLTRRMDEFLARMFGTSVSAERRLALFTVP